MIVKQPILAAILLATLCTISACSGKSPTTGSVTGSDTGHYSVKNFIRGQVKSLYGQPIVLERKLQTAEGLDSSMIPMTDVTWNEVLPEFAGADISDRKFNGAYTFSIADDNVTATRILTYTAKRPDLFTKVFQINTDPLDFKVKSIYIETRKSGFWRKVSQKLLYIPNNIIQIQETDDPLLGAVTNKRLEYRFPGSPGDDIHIVEDEQ